MPYGGNAHWEARADDFNTYYIRFADEALSKINEGYAIYYMSWY